MWIDSHCHLNHEKLIPAGSVDHVIQRAQAAGVDGMLTINCRISDELEIVLEIANRYDTVWCTIGTHPHDASDENEKEFDINKIKDILEKNSKIVGVGESGLDYYYTFSTPTDQQESFRKHIRVCLETGLPLVVHARDADADIIRILREEAGPNTPLKGVMHCFSSSAHLAEKSLEMGFYISFSGILTFPKSEELRQIAATVPMDRLLVETDAPYLAPAPYRGKTNEPAYVTHTGEMLASLKGVSPQTMAEATTHNFFALFDRARRTRGAGGT